MVIAQVKSNEFNAVHRNDFYSTKFGITTINIFFENVHILITVVKNYNDLACNVLHHTCEKNLNI